MKISKCELLLDVLEQVLLFLVSAVLRTAIDAAETLHIAKAKLGQPLEWSVKVWLLSALVSPLFNEWKWLVHLCDYHFVKKPFF